MAWPAEENADRRTMILTAERARLLSWFLVFFFSGYLFTGYVHVGSPTEGFLATSIDSTVPLLTWSIWIYCIHFLVMISSFFLIADPDSLRTFAGAVAISLVVSNYLSSPVLLNWRCNMVLVGGLVLRGRSHQLLPLAPYIARVLLFILAGQEGW